MGKVSDQSPISLFLQLKHKHRINWYDSLIIASAIEAECSVPFTEDLNHGQKFGLFQVQNPFL